MREKMSEIDRRFLSLPPPVRLYIAVGKSLDRENLPDPVRTDLKNTQLQLLTDMSLEHKAQMCDFLIFRDNQRRNGKRTIL